MATAETGDIGDREVVATLRRVRIVDPKPRHERLANWSYTQERLSNVPMTFWQEVRWFFSPHSAQIDAPDLTIWVYREIDGKVYNLRQVSQWYKKEKMLLREEQ